MNYINVDNILENGKYCLICTCGDLVLSNCREILDNEHRNKIINSFKLYLEKESNNLYDLVELLKKEEDEDNVLIYTSYDEKYHFFKDQKEVVACDEHGIRFLNAQKEYPILQEILSNDYVVVSIK